MKRILLASAMFSMCAYNAMANDCCADNGDERADLTGFLLSLGGVLDIDKYDADVAVAAKYDNIDGYKCAIAVAADDDSDSYKDTVAFMKDFAKMQIGAETKSAAITKDTVVYINTKTVYANRIVKVKKNKTVAGGEIKGSAFYNVENGLVVGFDLGLAFTAKGKKRVDINTKFAATPAGDANPYVLTPGALDVPSILANKTVGEGKTSGLKEYTDKDTPGAAEGDYIVYYWATSKAVADADANKGVLVSGGADYAAIVTPDVDGKIGSLEFEKDPFSPTAAFLVGGYFKGFFGALRLGINYMTGKVKGLQNAEGAAMTYADAKEINLDHKIRQISPVLGVQFMKHIKKGVFVYATYDHMFGARKSYLVNSPVKNFKRRQHRISLGLAYHIAQ